MYIADVFNNRVRKVTISTGIINTIAGTGSTAYNGENIEATSANLYYPHGVALDASGNSLASITHNLFVISLLTSIGNIYYSEYGNQRVRKITTTTNYPRYFLILYYHCRSYLLFYSFHKSESYLSTIHSQSKYCNTNLLSQSKSFYDVYYINRSWYWCK